MTGYKAQLGSRAAQLWSKAWVTPKNPRWGGLGKLAKSRAAVAYVRDAALLLQDDLGVAGDPSALDRWQAQGLVKGVGVKGLGAPKHSSHTLNGRPYHVVVWILLCKGTDTN